MSNELIAECLKEHLISLSMECEIVPNEAVFYWDATDYYEAICLQVICHTKELVYPDMTHKYNILVGNRIGIGQIRANGYTTIYESFDMYHDDPLDVVDALIKRILYYMLKFS